MITIFTILSIINGLILFALAIVIFLKGRSKNEIEYYRLEQHQKELMPYATIGTILVIILSFLLMI